MSPTAPATSLDSRQAVHPSGEPCLVVFDESGSERVHPLGERTIFIGRARCADVRIEDSAVSSLHAALFRKEGSWFLRDLDSTNGTFVNGDRVAFERLRPNDRIDLAGVVSLYFTDRGFVESAVERAAAAGAAASRAEADDVDVAALILGRASVYIGWAAESGRRLELGLEAPLLRARADAEALAGILDDLVRTSLRRSRPGGCVVLRAATAGHAVEMTISADTPPSEKVDTERLRALVGGGLLGQLVTQQGGTLCRVEADGPASFILRFPGHLPQPPSAADAGLPHAALPPRGAPGYP